MNSLTTKDFKETDPGFVHKWDTEACAWHSRKQKDKSQGTSKMKLAYLQSVGKEISVQEIRMKLRIQHVPVKGWALLQLWS